MAKAAPAPAKPAEQSADQQIVSRWPAYSWALNIPELKAILSDTSITDANELQAKIEGTGWWKGTQPAQRNWLARKQVDPAGANQDRQQKDADVWDRYLQLGLKPDVKSVQDLSEQALTMGWTDAQLNDAIVSHMGNDPTVLDQVGSMQTTAKQLKQTASAYYVNLDDQAAFNMARQVQAGEKKVEDFLPQMQTWAKSKFAYSPEVQQAIDNGSTVRDFFAPMQQDAAKLLELPSADSVDLVNDPKFSQITSFADPKTNQRRIMTISEMETYVRGMDQWKSTRQGQQAASDMAESLTKTFGKVA